MVCMLIFVNGGLKVLFCCNLSYVTLGRKILVRNDVVNYSILKMNVIY